MSPREQIRPSTTATPADGTASLPSEWDAGVARAGALVGERELLIVIWPDEFVQFEGTRAQLEAEGLIPDGFEWPRAADNKHWDVNGFSYWLRRTRPDGFKGPMKAWLDLDNWFVRVQVIGRDWHWKSRRRLDRKAEELAAEYRRHTAEGQREWDTNYARWATAVHDQAFQAFKALIPSLRPKRRRKSTKAAAS